MKSMIITLIYTSLFLGFIPTIALARTISPAEGNAIRRFVGFYDSITNIEGKYPSSWETVAKYDEGLESFEDYFPKGESIDTTYSFISEEDQAKFPNGELLLIRHKPTDWPEVWKNNPPNVDASELTKEQRAELKRLADREQPIRHLVYRNERDEIDSIWWFEADVQKMLTETGIRIPVPAPYQPPSVEVTKSPSVVVKTSSEPLAVKSVVNEPAEVVSVEIAEESPEESTNWLLWLIGALIVLGGLALVIRHKN